MQKQRLHIENPDDTKLWKSLIKGDENAFSLLFKKHYAQLIVYGNSFNPFPDKVQDCIQDVFTDIWLYRDNLNQDVVVKAYLLSCVRKRITKLKVRDKIFTFGSSVDNIPFLIDFSIEHHLIIDEISKSQVTHLNRLINALPSRQKEAIYLRFNQDLPIEQVATTLGINYQSANNLLHRAILSMREGFKNGTLILLLLLQVFCK
ncbi:sigma-70 family RNA polymerase sigma factor [Flavobacterium sp.]|uniref:RNA polymerase sigma factor n=1 Tax=Flavobacterium sp. TaxID=239 RepID=UPI00260B64A7|nr:sigma-70 family RNA polymerase sigma factor [Flavobacterium sp.]MDG2433752.1 sigma-70 family RNA polymerase sigma factor [Flavobacterium sp.]